MACGGTEAASDARCEATDCTSAECPPPGYAAPCEPGGTACDAPFACVEVEDHSPDEVDFACLEPCTSGCDCPPPCFCRGVNGDSDWGADRHCVCI
jgi:hypothetical protein